jgi:hypothetical protein
MPCGNLRRCMEIFTEVVDAHIGYVEKAASPKNGTDGLTKKICTFEQ